MTARPTGAWAAQQARNLAMDLGDRLGTLRFLVHDRNPVFTAALGEVFKAEGLRIITTLPKTPRMNATWPWCSVKYVSHYNGHRPHQSRQQRPPDMQAQPVRGVVDLRSVRRKPVVAGVINEYHHAA